MQPDIGDAVKRAAAAPTRPLDFHQALWRGRVQRGFAFVVASLGVAVLVGVGAVAYPSVSEVFNRDAAPGPAAGCDETDGAILIVYLNNDVADADRASLEAYLDEHEDVESFAYVSQSQAIAEFREHFADQPEYWEHLPEDALPPSYRVALAPGAPVDEIVGRVALFVGVEGVEFRENSESASVDC